MVSLLLSALALVISQTRQCFRDVEIHDTERPVGQTDKFFFSPQALVQNISTSENIRSWYDIVGDEDYLKDNKRVFFGSSKVKSFLNYTFLIEADKICAEDRPFLLVLIPSVVSNSDHRAAIRRTWLQAAETNSWPGVCVREQVKHLFLLGCSENSCAEDARLLLNESTIFEDIVMVNFIDSYRNLTTKILVGLKWTHEYCPQARFVIKVDEDTFINVPLLTDLLRHVSKQTGDDRFVMGLRHAYEKPLVVRDGMWAVSREDYPLSFYPAYLYGHAYVMHRQAVRDLVDAAYHVTLLAPEDAFITGILPKIANITRISAPSFTVCCRPIFDCEVVWNQKVALTDLKYIGQLERLWSNIVSHVCDNKVPFI